MTFSSRPWAARFTEMGDASEQKFLESVDGAAIRFGLSRPEGVHVPSMPERIRASPDFLTTSPTRLVECMGLGRAQHLQMKLSKWGVLHWWDGVMPVWVFVWDSSKKRKCMISLARLDTLINTPGIISIDYFDSSKLVLRIPANAVFEQADGA